MLATGTDEQEVVGMILAPAKRASIARAGAHDDFVEVEIRPGLFKAVPAAATPAAHRLAESIELRDDERRFNSR